MNRMRAYLAGTDVQEPAARSLAAVASGVAEEFEGLHVCLVVDLARDVVLDPGVAHDLEAALRSLLLNVAQHADADQVTVHAEASEDGDGWQLVVHDDGVGFDPVSTELGVGLRDLVDLQLGQHEITSTMASTPGSGTTVVLTAQGDR